MHQFGFDLFIAKNILNLNQIKKDGV